METMACIWLLTAMFDYWVTRVVLRFGDFSLKIADLAPSSQWLFSWERKTEPFFDLLAMWITSPNSLGSSVQRGRPRVTRCSPIFGSGDVNVLNSHGLGEYKPNNHGISWPWAMGHPPFLYEQSSKLANTKILVFRTCKKLRLPMGPFQIAIPHFEFNSYFCFWARGWEKRKWRGREKKENERKSREKGKKKDMTDRMPEDMPDRMSEDLPDRMPDRMSEDIPDRMPDRMLEDLPDRMSEDICQIECQKTCQIDMPDRMPDRYAR